MAFHCPELRTAVKVNGTDACQVPEAMMSHQKSWLKITYGFENYVMTVKVVQTHATQIILKTEIYRCAKLSLSNRFGGHYSEVARTLLCASYHGACAFVHA